MKVTNIDSFIEEFRNGRDIWSRSAIELAVREIERQRERIGVLENNLDHVLLDVAKKLSSANKRIAELEQERRWIPVSERLTDKNANTEIRKEFCPNCEAETPCTHEAELFVCDICGEDFAKYIVSRNCNVSDVSMTQNVLTDIKTPQSIERNNCIWVELDDPDIVLWATSCGNEFHIDDGKPSDNHMKFCCYCGKEIVEG